jgi:eukaryotic-like serine/threonine-protein kinase
MPSPSSITELLDLAQKSGILDVNRLSAYVQQLRVQNVLPADVNKLAGAMVRDGLLTLFQAEQLLLGKWKRFTIGKYKVLERLGSGGMGQVFLCEHKMMRRRVAVKVLPTAKADDPSSLERFYREARVVGALDHPNIVRAHDIDQDDNLHFLVMEFVDGPNLQEIVKRTGPVDPIRAAHYVYQSALGLQHAFDSAGIIHRDIKPGNILVDRQGVVKILDMGLARFFHDEEDLLTRKFDETVLGTADYLSPEQAVDSHTVDIRADIYSLGATFYFMLAGNPPFTDGTVAQKLIWHQTRDPKPIRSIRPEVPQELATIIEKMMAKDVKARYQSPKELADALAPFVTTPIPPPSEAEMPRLSPAALGLVGGTVTAPVNSNSPARTSGPASPPPKEPELPKPPPPRTSTSKSNIDLGQPPTTISGAPAATVEPAKAASPPHAPKPAAPKPPAPKVTAPPRPAPVAATFSLPTPTVETIENSPVWANITTDTPKPKPSSSDTGHNTPVYRPPSSASIHSFRLSSKPDGKPSNKKWLLLIAVGILLGALAVAAAFALGLFGPKKGSSQTNGTAHSAVPGHLIVDPIASADSPNTFRSIAVAARKAKTGDIIRVRGPAIEEEWINLDASSWAKNLTIEADAPSGQYVSWRFPSRPTDTKAVLYLANVNGWRFKGFEFDGQGRAENAVYITGKCPGLTFENCRAFNCTDSAIKLSNAAGDPDRPIMFARFRASGSPATKSVITLFASQNIQTIKANQYVTIQDGIIDGPCGALLTIQGSAANISIQRIRFFQGNDGIVVRPIKANEWCQLSLSYNSLGRISRHAISLEGLPTEKPPHECRFAFSNNLFANCQKVLNVADGKPIPNLTARDNVHDTASAEGNARIDFKVSEVKWLSEDPLDDRRFLRYDKGSPLNSRPLGPVGVPPTD